MKGLRPRHLIAGLAALAGLGVAQAPAAPATPAPSKEYVETPRATARPTKRKRKLPPLHGLDPNFPIAPAWLIAGSCNTYRLGALPSYRNADLDAQDVERLQRAYCQSLHVLRSSRGSQAMMRARWHSGRRFTVAWSDPEQLRLARNARRNARQRTERAA